MNHFARALTLTLSLFLGAASVGAQTRVIIKSDRTNVRAKPTLDAEILASLNKGQEVTVLGEVTPPKSQETWSRIAMPKAVTVWVYGPLVDSKAGTVRAKELNYRAGPGRNYSVLGELKRGDSFQVIREFDGWVQIEPPTGAVAYVASRLLINEPVPSPAPVAATPLTGSTPRVTAPTPQTTTPVRTVPAPTPIVSRTPEPPSAPLTTPVPTVTPVEPEPVFTPTPASPVLETPISSQSVSEPPSETNSTTLGTTRPIPVGSPRARNLRPPAPSTNVLLTQVPPPWVIGRFEPRFVVREGNVEPTISIQAPTKYELRDGFYREGALNYLFQDPPAELEKLAGKRVTVSGYEYQDSRWHLPVLKIESIQLLP